MNTQPQLHAFFTQTRVTVDLNPLSPTSTISLSLAHALDLPCIVVESSCQRCSATLIVPTYQRILSLSPRFRRRPWLVCRCDPWKSLDDSMSTNPPNRPFFHTATRTALAGWPPTITSLVPRCRFDPVPFARFTCSLPI